MKLAICVALVTALSASLALAENAERNPVLEKLAPGAWHYMNPAPSKRLVLEERNETSPVREETFKEPPFREYTSPAYGDGKIFHFGGGHSGYHGNDVDIFDPVANRWTQMYRPHAPPRDDSTYYSGGSERSYVDPKTGALEPYVLHGYARTGYDAGLGLYVSTTMFPEKVAQDEKTGEWKLLSQTFGLAGYDAKSNRWKLLASMPSELTSGQAGLSYDSQLGGLLGFSEHGVFLFKDGKWQRYSDANLRMVASGGAGITYLPKHKSHLIAVLGHGGQDEVGELVIYDVEKKTARRVESVPDELQARIGKGTGGYNLVHGYDPTTDRVIVLSVNKDLRPDVWTFDVAGDRWQKHAASDDSPKLFSVFEPGVGRAPLVYDPVHEVLFLIIRHQSEIQTWAFKAPAAS